MGLHFFARAHVDELELGSDRQVSGLKGCACMRAGRVCGLRERGAEQPVCGTSVRVGVAAARCA
eukprot:m.353811 g.353811  ORF g.353811 m.353811 type:complete len:64 (+) comp16836_c0_seq1:2152-2343(+)